MESDRIIPGKVDLTTGKLVTGDLNHRNDDVLDDLAEMVPTVREVVVLGKMPTTMGAAAIYRY